MKKFLKTILNLFFRNQHIADSYEIVITLQHLAGIRSASNDCPGYRAFKDVFPKWAYFFLSPYTKNWKRNTNSLQTWGSYTKDKANHLCEKNMMWVELGEHIIFKKI